MKLYSNSVESYIKQYGICNSHKIEIDVLNSKKDSDGIFFSKNINMKINAIEIKKDNRSYEGFSVLRIGVGQDFDVYRDDGYEIVTRFAGLIDGKVCVVVTARMSYCGKIQFSDTYSLYFSPKEGTIIPLSWAQTIYIKEAEDDCLTIYSKNNSPN